MLKALSNESRQLSSQADSCLLPPISWQQAQLTTDTLESPPIPQEQQSCSSWVNKIVKCLFYPFVWLFSVLSCCCSKTQSETHPDKSATTSSDKPHIPPQHTDPSEGLSKVDSSLDVELHTELGELPRLEDRDPLRTLITQPTVEKHEEITKPATPPPVQAKQSPLEDVLTQPTELKTTESPPLSALSERVVVPLSSSAAQADVQKAQRIYVALHSAVPELKGFSESLAEKYHLEIVYIEKEAGQLQLSNLSETEKLDGAVYLYKHSTTGRAGFDQIARTAHPLIECLKNKGLGAHLLVIACSTTEDSSSYKGTIGLPGDAPQHLMDISPHSSTEKKKIPFPSGNGVNTPFAERWIPHILMNQNGKILEAEEAPPAWQAAYVSTLAKMDNFFQTMRDY